MTKPQLPGVGVVVGRFQVNGLHEGHKAILDRANQHAKTIIFVGVHPLLVTKDNPLDFPTRKAMIQASNYGGAMVLPLPDTPTNEEWSRNLDKQIRMLVPMGPVTLYQGRDGFGGSYNGRFPVETIEQETLASGTRIRAEVGSAVQGAPEFRAGVIYAAHNMYPRVSPTVDIACIKEGTYVLLGQKSTRPGEWRFPGGFVDLSDVSKEAAAVRELHEETGLLVDTGSLDYVGSYRVPDWRNTTDTGIMTTLYAAPFLSGKAAAADDLGLVEWWTFDEMARLPMVEAHHALRDGLLAYRGRKLQAAQSA